MNVSDLKTFLRNLWIQGVELWLEGDQLRFKGNKQLLAGDALKILREHKSAIIELLEHEPLAYSGFVLSHGQRAIHLMQHLAPESAAYNQACLLQLRGKPDNNLLERSFDVLLQRHAPLRMSICELDGITAQQVSYTLPSILSSHRFNDAASLQAWVNTESDRPFQLADEPLIRARLLQCDDAYFLLLVAHHIIADFWALNVIIRELDNIYLAESTGSIADLPEIGKLFKDYVLLEKDWLISEAGLTAKNYWHQQLTPLPKTLELPTDFVRPARPRYQGTELSFTLGSALTQALKNQAKNLQVTPFVWVLSCYQLLMHRYSGSNDITVGSPVAGRLQKDFQLLAGHFTNPVVLRTQFDQLADFQALLEHNKAQVLQAMKYQQYPLQCLIEELNTEHDLHSTPLFQVAISWNQLNDNEPQRGCLIENVVSMEQRGAIYQLVLTCYDKGDDIQIAWRFNSDLYKKETIARYQEHLVRAIQSSVDQPEAVISAVEFISSAEKNLIKEINDTYRDVAQNISVAAIFEQTAQRFAQHTAFRDALTNSNYSYSELNQRANQLAHFLADQGLQPGDVVGLCLGRHIDMITSLLACVKSGIIYIPIDPQYPDERIATILATAEAKAFITMAERSIETGSTHIVLDHHRDVIGQVSNQFSIANGGYVHDDAVACIFFTSGSTGTPKGVEVPHRAIVRMTQNTNFAVINEQDRFCHLCNISFDASNYEIWASLLNGACLLNVDTDTLLNPPAFADFVAKEKPTGTVITTALFNLLVQYKPDIFKDFRYVMFGGEAADNTACNLCISHGKPDYLLNVYGPTENGTYSSMYCLENIDHGSIPIGFVVSNSQAYVFDQYDQLAPLGVIGELVVGGDGVAVGYRNRADLTAEKFLPDTLRGKGQLYRTGDLAWLRDDGMLMYAGRVDDQVKIRGFRIETREIEQAILRFSAINQCHVGVVKQGDNHFLAAWFVSDESINSHDLKNHLRALLPSFMVPSAYMQLAQLPLSPNGKIDKRVLPQPERTSTDQFAEPTTALEQAMSEIWQAVLGIEKIGIFDNFFELGGHSLLAAKLVSNIEATLGHNINMRQVFEYPDIAGLCSVLAGQDLAALSGIKAAEKAAQIPASLSQQRLWFLQQLNPQSTAYNMPLALSIKRSIKPARLELAIRQLLQRHESLRTSFIDYEGQAITQYHDVSDWQLPVLDFSQLSDKAAKSRANEQIQLLSQTVFDLQNGPLFEALLIQINPKEQVLAFCLHHIIIDGWSVNILLQELAQLLQEPGNTLPVLELQYSDFSLWQHQNQAQGKLDHQLLYWQQTLNDAPALINLPTDTPRPPVLSTEGAEYLFKLDQSIVEGLRELAKQHQASLFMVMLAGFAVLLSRYSQQDDICIGFPISGRNQKALDPLIGLFVNNLVIRSQFNENTSVSEHIKNVRSATLDAFAHQDVPFDSIIDALKLERSLSYTPLLQVSFALEEQSFTDRIAQNLGQDFSLLPLEWQIAKYDINLSCYENTTGEISANLEYSTDLFESASMARLGEHYKQILSEMVKKPTVPVNLLQLLTPREKQQQENLLLSSRDKASVNISNAINSFEIQAAKYAERIALSFDQQHISYRELNQKSNRLARALVTAGIGQGSFVGLYLDRSPDIIISILAVLKTGAAYIPLDPFSPSERVNFIIEDAGIEHIISNSESSASLGRSCLLLDSLLAQSQSYNSDNLNIHLPLENPAYVIYTSGTTGKPKGCVVSHKNMARLFSTSDAQFGFNEQDVWTLFHSYAFDFSVWEIWGALLYGGRLVIVPYWMSRSPDAFYQLLIDEKVTVLNQTPSAFSQLISIDQQAPQKLSLRCVIFGGEALDFSPLLQWIEHHPLHETRLINMYGITETTVHVTFHEVSVNELTRGRSIIGKPLNDLHIWLLDSQQNPVPDGIIGEMYVSGAGVTKGYLHRPQLTAERFIHNPIAATLPKDIASNHDRLYRTGDLARRLANGDLEYLGRSDHQVKIRGHRIELGEIEAVLNAQEGVLESIVRAGNDAHGHKQLQAWLLCKPDLAPDVFALRQGLKTYLPDYMIPAAFVCVEQWPLTANGKINTAALPSPELDSLRHQYIAPRNETEQRLCEIWSEILGIEKIGVHDNFFELGGHSLLATRVAARIRTELQCPLELRLIFENPTIESLGLAILEQELEALDFSEDDLQSLLQELDKP